MKKLNKETIKAYFRNLWDALLGRTDGIISEAYSVIDGLSEEVFDHVLEKEFLQKQLDAIANKPVKKRATTAQKAPKKKPSGK